MLNPECFRDIMTGRKNKCFKMKILQSPYEKVRYRDMENILFDTNSLEHQKIIIKNFKNIRQVEFEHSEIGQERFYNKIRDIYSSTFSEFCVSSIVNEYSFSSVVSQDPIYLFDLKHDTYDDYEKIMWYPPSQDNKNFPFENGLAIVYELVLLYNTELKWCIVSDRYNDVILFGSDYEI